MKNKLEQLFTNINRREDDQVLLTFSYNIKNYLNVKDLKSSFIFLKESINFIFKDNYTHSYYQLINYRINSLLKSVDECLSYEFDLLKKNISILDLIKMDTKDNL